MATQDAPLVYGYLASPVGRLLLAGDDAGLRMISFQTGRDQAGPDGNWQRDDAHFAPAAKQLNAYFAGELTSFDLPLHFAGTGFQNEVWRALCDIPFGRTITYGELARRIGRPKSSRAVGAANGANPLPIVVPCHRVIGADNSLTGFSSGIEIKKHLLDHEGASWGNHAAGQGVLAL